MEDSDDGGGVFLPTLGRPADWLRLALEEGLLPSSSVRINRSSHPPWSDEVRSRQCQQRRG